MREIKFRVWDKVTKQMFTGFHLFGEMTLVGGIHAWQAEEAKAIGIKRDTVGALNDLVEMQYTGLKDKNGKEIYEGDVIQIKHPFKDRKFTGAVEYLCPSFGCKDFYFSHYDNPRDISWDGTQYIEVIGNIYENPELLE